MLSQLNWPLRYLAMVGLGTVLGVSMLILARPRVLRIIGALPFLSPNWLSIWRAPIVGAGSYMYLAAAGRQNWLTIGLLLVVVGFILDRIDGKVAKSLIQRLRFLPGQVQHGGEVSGVYNFDAKQLQPPGDAPVTKSGLLWAYYAKEELDDQGNRRQVDHYVIIDEWISGLTSAYTRLPMFRLERDATANFPALRLSLTGIGDWLDPLIDKLTFHPFLVYMALNHMISWPLVVLMFLIDMMSTFLRSPFDQVRPFNRLQRYVRDSRASAFGKTKVLSQMLTLISLMPVSAGWLNQHERDVSWVVANSLLGLGVLSGILSVVSRLTLMEYLLKLPGLRRFNKNLKEIYEHDVTEED